MNELAISFCIVCMNRLHQLEKTLITNILNNKNYGNLEFILLNYNSEDGMEEWVRKNLSPYLHSGRVKYYHTTEPQKFNHSHSKNLMFNLAKGLIVCNINADHFTGPRFAEYINETFQSNRQIVMTTIDYFGLRPDYWPNADLFGLVAVKKSDFERVNGFDEHMSGYGFEDMDFINRLQLSGLTPFFIEHEPLHFIKHSVDERYKMYALPRFVFIDYINFSRSEVIILKNNGCYLQGILVDNVMANCEDYHSAIESSASPKFDNSLTETGWSKGRWCTTQDGFLLKSNERRTYLVKQVQGSYIENHTQRTYYHLTDDVSIRKLLQFTMLYRNRAIMEKNLYDKQIVVNKKAVGRATLYKNFSQNPIQA